MVVIVPAATLPSGPVLVQRKGTITVQAPLPEHMAASWAFFGFDESEAGEPFVAFDED